VLSTTPPAPQLTKGALLGYVALIPRAVLENDVLRQLIEMELFGDAGAPLPHADQANFDFLQLRTQAPFQLAPSVANITEGLVGEFAELAKRYSASMLLGSKREGTNREGPGQRSEYVFEIGAKGDNVDDDEQEQEEADDSSSLCAANETEDSSWECDSMEPVSSDDDEQGRAMDEDADEVALYVSDGDEALGMEMQAKLLRNNVMEPVSSDDDERGRAMDEVALYDSDGDEALGMEKQAKRLRNNVGADEAQTPAAKEHRALNMDDTPAVQENGFGQTTPLESLFTKLLDAFAGHFGTNAVPNTKFRFYDAFTWLSWIVQHLWIYQTMLQRLYLLRRYWKWQELPRSTVLFMILWHSATCAYVADRPPGTSRQGRVTMPEFGLKMGQAADQEHKRGLLFDTQLIGILRSPPGTSDADAWFDGLPALVTDYTTGTGRRVIDCLGKLEHGPPETQLATQAFRGLKQLLKCSRGLLDSSAGVMSCSLLKTAKVERVRLIDTVWNRLFFSGSYSAGGAPLRALKALDTIESPMCNQRGQLLVVMNLIQYHHWKHDKMQELRAERKKSHRSAAATARAASPEIAEVASNDSASAGEKGGSLDEEAELQATVKSQANLELMVVAYELLRCFAGDMLVLYLGLMGSTRSRGGRVGGRVFGSKEYSFAAGLLPALRACIWDSVSRDGVSQLPMAEQIVVLRGSSPFEETVLHVFSQTVVCEAADLVLAGSVQAVSAHGAEGDQSLVEFSFPRGGGASSAVLDFVNVALEIMQSPQWQTCASYALLYSALGGRDSPDIQERLDRIRPSMVAVLLHALPVQSIWLCLPVIKRGGTRLFGNQRSFWQLPML
jgi:hypothetical protein